MKKNLITALPIMLLLVACGNTEGEESGNQENNGADSATTINAEGMPISNEQIEKTFFAGKGAMNVNSDWNDIFLWNTYEEMTNIDITWDEYLTDAVEEQRNLSLVSGNLPDVYYLANFPNTDIYRYGQQGVFQPLNDYIEEYAPNLSQLMEDNPEIRSSITFPDGNIYSMPSIIEEEFVSVRIGSRPWINKELLDEIGMDVPESTEEFYDVLTAIKEHDDSITPYGGTSIDELVQYLAGSFGVMNQGVRNGPIDTDDESGEVRFYATTDEYRELLEYVNVLYTEGLIDQNIFTIEWGQFLANASDSNYGSMVFYDPVDLFGEETGNQFDSLSALEGPDGHQSFVKLAPMVNTIGNFLVTEVNENPEAAVRWMDHFYSDEGSKFYYMGVEGETYEEIDGELNYVDSIRNPEDGSTFEQELSKQLTWIGATQGIIKADYFRGSESAEMSMEAADKIEPYIPEDGVWAGFTYTDDENTVLASNGTDIEQYVAESRDRFIVGDLSFDEWDSYVSTIEGMNLEEYMSIKQDAYDRYLSE